MKKRFRYRFLVAFLMTGLLPVVSPAHLFAATTGHSTLAQRPVIHKEGTLELNIVETTPFVFHGKVYRLEWWRAAGCLRIMDRTTNQQISRFGKGYRFPCAYVEHGTVYVVGTLGDHGWYGDTLTMFTSTDLKHWHAHQIFKDPKLGICNTSLCKAGKRYVMSIEMTHPGGFPGRFLESTNLTTWTLMPPRYRHDLGRYNATHCLRWHAGWYYLFYLEAGKPHGYEQYVTRSRDLIHWKPSPVNPVLAASAADKQIANPHLTAKDRAHIQKAADRNNSDIDFCQYHGKLIINYSWGNQQGTEFLAEALYDGTEVQFLTGWFPPEAAHPPHHSKKAPSSHSHTR